MNATLLELARRLRDCEAEAAMYPADAVPTRVAQRWLDASHDFDEEARRTDGLPWPKGSYIDRLRSQMRHVLAVAREAETNPLGRV